MPGLDPGIHALNFCGATQLRMPLTCAECMRLDIETAHFIAHAEIQDDNLYEVKCPKGHFAYVVLQEQKFELLFDVGACALLDGYYREAISSFTSSLERFYEFFVRASLMQKGHTPAHIDATWKQISKQSERQLGAYLIHYLSECGTIPTVLAAKQTELRNEVIHHGRIPTRNEAITYGQNVLDIVRPALAIAKKNFPDGVRAQILSHMISTHEKRKPDVSTATSCMPTIISLSRDDEAYNQRSLEASLSDLKMWNWLEIKPGTP